MLINNKKNSEKMSCVFVRSETLQITLVQFTAKREDFTDVVFLNCLTDGKMYNKHTLNKALFITLRNLTCFLKKGIKVFHI